MRRKQRSKNMETPDDFPNANSNKYYSSPNPWFDAEHYMSDVEGWFAVVLVDDEEEREEVSWLETIDNLGKLFWNVGKLIFWVGVLLFLIEFLFRWFMQ